MKSIKSRESAATRAADRPSTATRRVAYSLAAGAVAGVAASPADAAVVASGPQNISVGIGNSQNINLDLDGSQDIKFRNGSFGYQAATINYGPGKIAGFIAGPSSFKYVSALTGGTLIDAALLASSPSFYGSMAYGASNPNAQFNNAVGKFVGLSFPSGVNTYYGWVRVDVSNANKSLIIRDWAYESTPGVGITTPVPEPATLGLLATGALGVAGLRRRRKAAHSVA